MTHPLAAEVRRLRTDEELSARQIRERLGIGKELLQELLRGVPPPEWTRRPNAKDELRARAVELRGQGWSVNAIADELKVSKSTAYLWVRHLPFDKDPEAERARRQAHSKVMTDARWGEYRVARDELETGIRDKAARWLVELFLRFVEALGVDRQRLTYRVSIHESADALAACRWWANQIGIEMGVMRRPTLKRHKPGTNRHNTSDDYHGCLVVDVPRSRRLYVRIEGLMAGVFGALTSG